MKIFAPYLISSFKNGILPLKEAKCIQTNPSKFCKFIQFFIRSSIDKLEAELYNNYTD